MSTRDREDLLYLRPEDLDPDERAAREALLAESEDARRVAADVERLTADLGEVAHTDEGPPLERLLARLEADPMPAPANNTRWWIGGIVALAAALLLVPMLREQPYRDKGLGGVTARVTLEAVAEGPRGVRPLDDGAVVAADERVVFFVTTTDAGVLRLTEGTLDLLGAPWRVEAGRQAPGGATPLSYRPDAPIEGAAYAAEWCPADVAFGAPGCVRDGLSLRWAP